jgi:hypothetical protein
MAETLSTPGTDPTTGLYHVDHMPMTDDPAVASIREKQLSGTPLTIGENLQAGRDSTVDVVDGYELKPDHAYRTVGEGALAAYKAAGAVVGFGEGDEYEPGNNKGVDWYLGGAALRYGGVVLEVPADPSFFEPASNWGHHLAKDPRVRHMKSSGHTNPVPLDSVRVLNRPEA